MARQPGTLYKNNNGAGTIDPPPNATIVWNKQVIDYSKLKKALKHLESQFGHYQTLDPTLPDFLQEAMAESVIQRFETTYDCLWKVLKRHLIEAMGLPDVPNSPKPLFRIANENRLLPSPIEQWIRYANLRVATAHDYSGEKAREALNEMDNFIHDTIALYQQLTNEPWA